MKKILTLVVLSSTALTLHADYKSSDQRGQYPGQQYQGQSSQQPTQGRSYSSTYESTTTTTQPAPSAQPGTSTQYRSYSSNTYDNGTTPQQYGGSSDQALSSKVQNTLEGSKYSKITATVKNGIVTLQGDVNSAEEKVSLGALVGGIDGVKSVNNQVTVQGQEIRGSTYNQQGYRNSNTPNGYPSPLNKY